MSLRKYVDEVFAPWRREANPGSWRQEERCWKAINADIGGVRLRRVDEFVFADHLDRAIATRGPRKGQPLAGNTKRLRRAAMQALLKRAYRLRHIDTLPDLAMFRIKGARGSSRKSKRRPKR